MKLKRLNDIILGSRKENLWESRAVLNPGVVREKDFVHMLYRAVEGENFSTIGYAKLDREGNVLERLDKPVVFRDNKYEKQGVEDPRISYLDGTYYVIYSAFDGSTVRISMVETKDFRTYEKIGKIGPDTTDKDAMLFNEKINGKIILIHRIDTSIQFAYFDDIDHLKNPGANFWENHLNNLEKFTVMKREYWWEKEKIGGGAPAEKTDEGWLFIYHGVDENFVYRSGAALLDLDYPEKVIARLPEPILEPETEYEKIGDVNNVVFPSGAAIFNDLLYVYYGGADKTICIAYIEIDEILHELKKHKI